MMDNIETKDLNRMLVAHQQGIERYKVGSWVRLYHMDMVVAIATELLKRYRQETALLYSASPRYTRVQCHNSFQS